MINKTLDTVNKLQTALLLAEVFVSGLPKNTPFQKFEPRWRTRKKDLKLINR